MSYRTSLRLMGDMGLTAYEKAIASRLCGTLIRNKLTDWREVAKIPVDELMSIPGLGRKSMEVLVGILHKKDLDHPELRAAMNREEIQMILGL